MPLTAGTRLGPYEILSALGAGGMGEVYLARDTRLDRSVAIKVLIPNIASDPDLRARFEREARAVAALDHPHICGIYDVGEAAATHFIVMPYLDGQTLATRLEHGPLPLNETLKIATEIAEALDKAHRQGIFHRDLKPANIMLTKAGSKLLDFGLAKLKTPAGPISMSGMTRLATSAPQTASGTILGTVQYMAPEQVEGGDADARSDIWALGAVLYEMATGAKPFKGDTPASVIGAILKDDLPLISSLRPTTPPALERVVRKCLAKDPDKRWQSASDLASELNWIAEGGPQAGEAESVSTWRRRWERGGWLVAATSFVLMTAGGVAWWKSSSRRPPPMYFHASVPFAANDLALSPDGRTLAMVAYSAQASDYVLWTYEVGGRRTASLDGTRGASYPFWSPDGRSIGFFADGKLKKVDVSGGQVQVLCDAPNGRGGTWNRDDVIVFTPGALGVGLFRVSASGGSPVEITKPDTTRLETSHRWPVFLPDGKHFLYLAANFSGQFEINAIFLSSLDSKEKRLIVSTNANAAYAEPGYLVYLRDKTLVAQRFDPQRYVLSGEPHTVSDEVLYLPSVDKAVFSVSGGDVLVTQTGKGASVSQLTWFDRSGKQAGTVGVPGSYDNVRLSPDGRRIATDQSDANGRNIDIWVHEQVRGATTRLTFDPSLDQTPIWSPNGKQILFTSNRKLGFYLYLKNADGSAPEKQVADLGALRGVGNLAGQGDDTTVGRFAQVNAWDWSRDGKYALVRKENELWYLSWPERVTKPLLQPKWAVRNAQFSADGRWMAYASNETGSWEIYVSPFPNVNNKWLVSSAGGQEPRWRQDDKELFYLSPDGRMMTVTVATGVSFEAGPPVALFQTHRRQGVSVQASFSYDVSGDGQRFLIATKVDEAYAAPLSILLNWAAEMEK